MNHPDGTAACVQRMLKAGMIEVEADGLSMGSPIPPMTAHLEEVVAARQA